MVKIKFRFFLLAALVAISTSGIAQSKSPDHLNFPARLIPDAPHDVDQALQKKLTAAKKFDEIQRLFEILSWQNFVALNWPHDAKGKAHPRVSHKGDPGWIHWKESSEVYLPDGRKPAPWGVQELPPDFKAEQPGHALVLYRTSKASQLKKADIDDEINQAFTAPIWDQNGQLVRYQILINRAEFDYLVNNELYNIDGQIAFSKANKSVAFPSASRKQIGAVELKLAWKVIDPKNDIAERFFTQHAYVFNPDKTYSKALVGLVGMHITLKTQSSPQWIWSTFEHVDNLETNPLTKVHGKKLKPSFYDPDCDICPINRSPGIDTDYTNSKTPKNQIQRVRPISKATEQLNKQVQQLLGNQQSVLQYYQLIGTQWPTEPSAAPYPVSEHNASNPPQLPDAVTNKSGGKPTPVYLTNMVMETYFQGATDASGGVSGYNTNIANATAWHQIQGFQQFGSNNQLIFSTESCIGCHYSGAIATGETVTDGKRTAIYGKPASADFSWLLQLKAQFKSAKTPP